MINFLNNKNKHSLETQSGSDSNFNHNGLLMIKKNEKLLNSFYKSSRTSFLNYDTDLNKRLQTDLNKRDERQSLCFPLKKHKKTYSNYSLYESLNKELPTKKTSLSFGKYFKDLFDKKSITDLKQTDNLTPSILDHFNQVLNSPNFELVKIMIPLLLDYKFDAKIKPQHKDISHESNSNKINQYLNENKFKKDMENLVKTSFNSYFNKETREACTSFSTSKPDTNNLRKNKENFRLIDKPYAELKLDIDKPKFKVASKVSEKIKKFDNIIKNQDKLNLISNKKFYVKSLNSSKKSLNSIRNISLMKISRKRDSQEFIELQKKLDDLLKTQINNRLSSNNVPNVNSPEPVKPRPSKFESHKTKSGEENEKADLFIEELSNKLVDIQLNSNHQTQSKLITTKDSLELVKCIKSKSSYELKPKETNSSNICSSSSCSLKRFSSTLEPKTINKKNSLSLNDINKIILPLNANNSASFPNFLVFNENGDQLGTASNKIFFISSQEDTQCESIEEIYVKRILKKLENNLKLLRDENSMPKEIELMSAKDLNMEKCEIEFHLNDLEWSCDSNKEAYLLKNKVYLSLKKRLEIIKAVIADFQCSKCGMISI
jgi:hypothetical protein